MNAHMRSILLLSLISLGLITQIGASCMNTDTTTRDDRGDLDSSVSIPRDARKVAEGTGELAYSAHSDGRVYLYDIDDRVVVDNGDIESHRLDYVAISRLRTLKGVLPGTSTFYITRITSFMGIEGRNQPTLYSRASLSAKNSTTKQTKKRI